MTTELPLGTVAESAPRESEPALAGRRMWAVTCGLLIAAAVLSMAVDAVFDRNFIRNIADGVCYIDIAHEVAHGNRAALLNGYWSPAYPVVLYAGLSILHPSPARELAAIYGINLAIGIFALCCFLYFVFGLPAARGGTGIFGLSRPMLVALGAALVMIAIQIESPVE